MHSRDLVKEIERRFQVAVERHEKDMLQVSWPTDKTTTSRAKYESFKSELAKFDTSPPGTAGSVASGKPKTKMGVPALKAVLRRHDNIRKLGEMARGDGAIAAAAAGALSVPGNSQTVIPPPRAEFTVLNPGTLLVGTGKRSDNTYALFTHAPPPSDPTRGWRPPGARRRRRRSPSVT